MPPNLESLWDDENFTVQAGVISGKTTLSGTDVGSGIIYYPVNANLTHRLAGTLETITVSQRSHAGLTCLWNAGPESEIFNPNQGSSRFIRVRLKPSHQLTAELPQNFFGVASAALLQDDWAEPFKESVREDLDAIREFIEPLRSGQTPSRDASERAVLAKQDLDLKLFWSAREYSLRGIFNRGYVTTALAAATPATGLINVTANTKDSANSAVSGCEVRYVTRINHNKPGKYKSFSLFSTPTSEHLSVANYDMWAEKGGLAGPRRNISVVSVTTAQVVDLLAP